MILKKITDDHYVVVDDSEIKEGDWTYNIQSKTIFIATNSLVNLINSPNVVLTTNKKITHSTLPLEDVIGLTNKLDAKGWVLINPIYVHKIKELIGEVDVEKKMISPYPMDTQNDVDWCNGYQRGYNQAIEDNKDKIDKILDYLISKMESISQDMIDKDSLQLGRFRTYKQIYEMIKPKTEWEVTFDEQGKLRLL